MRKLLPLLSLVAALVVTAPPAHAGENKHLGVMLMTGASITNFTTAAPFVIPPGQKISIYCSASGVQMLTDSTVVSTGTTGTKGILVPGTQLFPSSVGIKMGSISNRDSAGIAMIGTAAVTCDVWQRLGTE